ncbi:HutD/Ves family protein [Roseateles koreensis]|uniref:HutD family protein n=1 Tax=Roseateles koreensis TaxID=2987526 RepID=A0ABT5KUZ7_9BURK|nr:HutD family protein [Roseateles koreensis]MDC8786657.1 HutD family protein [Roseateles koreensis]
MSWSIINTDAVIPQAWRNGGGSTRELLAWPHSHDWIVRISVADIVANGPFSSFEGIDRWFAVLQGDGVRFFEYELRIDDELLHFDGALAPDCELLGGPTRDFNLMHRRGKGRLTVLPAAAPLKLDARCRWLALFTAQGGTLSHGARTTPLSALSLAWCENPAPQPATFIGAGAAWWMIWSDEA